MKDIASVVKDIAAEFVTTPSRVALARTLLNPAATEPIVGAQPGSARRQPRGLDVRLGPAQRARLAEVRAIELDSPRGALRRLDLTRQTASARCGLGQQIGCVR